MPPSHLPCLCQVTPAFTYYCNAARSAAITTLDQSQQHIGDNAVTTLHSRAVTTVESGKHGYSGAVAIVIWWDPYLLASGAKPTG